MYNGRFRASQPAGFAVRLALFYAAVFIVAGTKLPYFPIWLDGRGLTTSEIALIAALPLFIRILVTPAIGIVADARGDRRIALVVFAWTVLISFLVLVHARGFWQILAVTSLLSVASMSLMPFVETIAMAGVRRFKLDYGRMRLWGSLSFIGASFYGGLAIAWGGHEAVLWILIAGAATTVAAAHLLPGRNGDGSGDPEDKTPTPPVRESLALVVSPPFALFILAVATTQASHAVFYTFGVLHWQARGISSTWAGVLWAVGVTAEVGLFAFSRRLVDVFGSIGMIVAGALAGAIRWAVMAFDPPLAVLLPLQALHGLTYGASHLGAVHWMSERVGASMAGTAQSFYSSITHGVAMGIATIAAGRLYADWQAGAYWAMAGLSVVGMAAAVLLGRRYPPAQS